MYDTTIRLGLPHTNRWGFAEPLLLMHAGDAHWAAIAEAIGTPLSSLRTRDGERVYATFFYIDIELPDHTPLDSFRLDDHVQFLVDLRASRRMAVDGQIVFDRPGALPVRDPSFRPATARGRHPYIHFANIFITPSAGNSRLRVAAPANGDFDKLPQLPNEENAYHATRAALEPRQLGLIEGGEWLPLDAAEAVYAIDPERDTNGAGLVYFANYVWFMDVGERAALDRLPGGFDSRQGRIMQRRRIAYYGNVSLDDQVVSRAQLYRHKTNPALIAGRYEIIRREDNELICLSEAIKRVVGV